MSRVVVVTGGASGIGDAIVRSFAADGDEVVALDLVEPVDPVGGVRYVRADVSSAESVQEAFAPLERVDVLVSNAGIQRAGLVGEQAAADWLAVVATHLHGAFFCASAAVPRMARGGAIVSISSTVAFVALPGRSAYAAAKAGILAFTRTLALELAPRGIRANAVCPGWTRTPLLQRAIDDGSLDATWMRQRVPMDRLAETAEIARVVRFLASDDASYVTGQQIVADGGWTIQGIHEAPDWLRGS